MIVYSLILFILILLYPLYGKKKVLLHGEYMTLNSRIYIYIVSFILVAFLGLRGTSVGIDTFQYYGSFNLIKFLSLSETLDVKVEHGYRLFQFVIGRSFGNFQFLLIIVGILYIGVVSYYIYKYSENPMLSYILFIFFDFYTFAMSATRQTIAIALVMIAFKFIKEKKILKFLFCVLLASSFHITALIFLPCYWFNKFKLNKKTIFIFIIISIAVIGLKNPLQILMSNYARIDYAATETGGYRMYLIMLISTLLGIIYRKPFLSKNENNKYLFYMMVATVIIMPVIKLNPVMMRLYYYFFIFMIIYIPNITNVIKDKAIRTIIVSLYTLVGALWFFTSIIHIEHLESYLFFWQ